MTDMIDLNKQHNPERGLTRSMNVIDQLTKYEHEYNKSLYYSLDECRAYLDQTYPTIESAFVDILRSFDLQVSENVAVGDMTYDYGILSQKMLFVFAHNLTHSHVVNVKELLTDGLGIGTYFFANQQAVVNANQHGYECIYIFDWDDLFDISMMFMPKTLVSCANCEVDVISESELTLFLDMYHLRKHADQGSNVGYAHLGLYYDDDLLYVLTVGEPRYQKNYSAEIYRVCRNPEYYITGGWKLLFDSYVSSFHPDSVIALRDMAKAAYSTYDEMGMTLIGYNMPRTFWGRGHERLTEGPRFIKTLNLQYTDKYPRNVQNLSAMLEHGWIPITDCGSAVYEWRI